MMVSTKAYNGDMKLTPWNFKHNNVKSIGLKVNGQFTPLEPYQPNFKKEDVKREYLNLHLGTGHAGFITDDIGLLLVDWLGGNTIFAFNLAPDLFLSGHGQPARLNNIGIDILFREPLAENNSNVILSL